MEEEKIIYFYPEQTEMEKRTAAKRFWFREPALRVRRLGESGCNCGDNDGDAAFSVMGCAVPLFYHRRRPWKPQMLSEAMENVLRHVEGMADTYLHPQIESMLTEEYCRRYMPTVRTMQMLISRLIGQYADRVVRQSGEVSVLLGEPQDTDSQMEMTRALLLPYLPRINRLLIFYEEVAETDIWMELGSHLDEYYYEYGLVPQLEPYGVSHAGADTLRCGRSKCGGMILDFAAEFRYPKILPESRTVYIDILSESGKEHLLGRKTPQIPYVSPLKYLDTMVKNSYYSMT